MVTGGAGYIGAHVVRAFSSVGITPVVVDDLSTGRAAFVPPEVTLVQGDILDVDLLTDTLDRFNCTGVVHVAGFKYAGVSVKRVGLVGLEKVPVREGAAIVDAHGSPLGRVTSGTLGPTVHEPIAMAYLAVNHAGLQHEVYAEVRGKRLPMRISPMPFTPHRYQR